MDFLFLVKCFFIGISACSGVGPIFILTFNRGALYGFTKGFASALGSALADGLFFALGLFGALKLLESSRHSMLLLDLFGGIILITIGTITLRRYNKGTQISYVANQAAILTGIKSFFLTIVNPFVALFFMFISVQILPEGVSRLPVHYVLAGSIAAMAGSLSVLGSVAWIASHLRHAISHKKLRRMSYVTALLFIGVGVYMLGDFVIDILRKFIS